MKKELIERVSNYYEVYDLIKKSFNFEEPGELDELLNDYVKTTISSLNAKDIVVTVYFNEGVELRINLECKTMGWFQYGRQLDIKD